MNWKRNGEKIQGRTAQGVVAGFGGEGGRLEGLRDAAVGAMKAGNWRPAIGAQR
jgi:hypothetical protein